MYTTVLPCYTDRGGSSHFVNLPVSTFEHLLNTFLIIFIKSTDTVQMLPSVSLYWCIMYFNHILVYQLIKGILFLTTIKLLQTIHALYLSPSHCLINTKVPNYTFQNAKTWLQSFVSLNFRCFVLWENQFNIIM